MDQKTLPKFSFLPLSNASKFITPGSPAQTFRLGIAARRSAHEGVLPSGPSTTPPYSCLISRKESLASASSSNFNRPCRHAK